MTEVLPFYNAYNFNIYFYYSSATTHKKLGQKRSKETLKELTIGQCYLNSASVNIYIASLFNSTEKEREKKSTLENYLHNLESLEMAKKGLSKFESDKCAPQSSYPVNAN